VGSAEVAAIGLPPGYLTWEQRWPTFTGLLMRRGKAADEAKRRLRLCYPAVGPSPDDEGIGRGISYRERDSRLAIWGSWAAHGNSNIKSSPEEKAMKDTHNLSEFGSFTRVRAGWRRASAALRFTADHARRSMGDVRG